MSLLTPICLVLERNFLMTNLNLDRLPPSGNFMDLLKDEAWWKMAIEAEELLGSGPLAGVPPTA